MKTRYSGRTDSPVDIADRVRLAGGSKAVGMLLVLLGANGLAYLIATGVSRTTVLDSGLASIPVLPILAALAFVEGIVLLVPAKRVD